MCDCGGFNTYLVEMVDRHESYARSVDLVRRDLHMLVRHQACPVKIVKQGIGEKQIIK